MKHYPPQNEVIMGEASEDEVSSTEEEMDFQTEDELQNIPSRS